VHTARVTIARVSALQNANTAHEICTLQKCVRMAPKKQDVMAWNRRARGRKKSRRFERNTSERKREQFEIVGQAKVSERPSRDLSGLGLGLTCAEESLLTAAQAPCCSSPLFPANTAHCAPTQLTDCRRYGGP